jgi:hypothetical protein
MNRFRKIVFYFGVLITGFLILLLVSPMFLYWWGLSNVEVPVPSKLKLTAKQEQEIWLKEREVGTPRIDKTTPYGYIIYFSCNTNEGLYSAKCMSEYPGLRISALAVRNQVAEQVRGKGSTVWQVTWMAYTIWATRNWDVHQILSTYYEAYNS